MNKSIAFLTVVLILFSSCTSLPKDSTSTASSSSQNKTPEPYAENEFPDWLKQTRRTTIITAGSLPFISFQATMFYTFYRYFEHNMEPAYLPNPLAKSSTAANLNADEQLKILKFSVFSSITIGVTDLIISCIKEAIAKNQEKKAAEAYSNIVVTAVDGAVELPLPEIYKSESTENTISVETSEQVEVSEIPLTE